MSGRLSMPDTAAGVVPDEHGGWSAGGRRRRIQSALAAAGGCAAAGSAGYALSSPVVAAAGLVAAAAVAAIVGAAVVVMLSVMLGGRDPRSPFERLMLVICVITGRRPGDHLPPVNGSPSSGDILAGDHDPTPPGPADRARLRQ
jgi:hypothetical protein